MIDSTFVDSNIWIYLLSDDKFKKSKALTLLRQKPTISTQVLSENANVCLKKLKLSHQDIFQHLQELTFYCQVVEISSTFIFDALRISAEYKYSFYDSLIVATALNTSCEVLYSEDLQHNQNIDKKLKILNPFL